jgi:predicted GTPase
MGPTGAGKSSVSCLLVAEFTINKCVEQFINIATGQTDTTVGHSLSSCTEKVQAIICRHPDNTRNVVFVDTPGFDDTYITDTDILIAIANWLTAT